MEAVNHQPAVSRRIGIAVILAAVALLSTACAQGQKASTATDRPAIDGTIGQVGQLKLEDVSIQAPNVASRPTGTSFYAVGDDAPMTIVIVNNGHNSDTLTSVTGPFTSWAVVATGSASDPTAIQAGAKSQAVAPGAAVSLGLSGLGVGTGTSPDTLVLHSLTGKQLYPGSEIPLTFTFANAGTITLQVPVQLTAAPNSLTVSPEAPASSLP